ncbi:hypothetical protein N7931_04280 [Catenovulum sp. 2E275]|uniref:hypothetical protein n=1 Tax=Catenovulum sp. 2E275 TaxID=2980497 RepID=UPI0021D2F481|nr:hypothetical protein [Catenovulum sp. 2E275]MCU4674847.1 hypothetical protein [Catenovulum sp. 2E275]
MKLANLIVVLFGVCLLACEPAPTAQIFTEIEQDIKQNALADAEIKSKTLLQSAINTNDNQQILNARILLARIYYLKGDFVNTLRFYQPLLESSIDNQMLDLAGISKSDWSCFIHVSLISEDSLTLTDSILSKTKTVFDPDSFNIYQAHYQLQRAKNNKQAAKAIDSTVPLAPLKLPELADQYAKYHYAAVISEVDPQQSIEILSSLSDTAYKLPEAILLQAQIEQKQALYQSAIKHYVAFLKHRPDRLDAKVMLILIAYKTEQYELARDLVKQLGQAKEQNALFDQLAAPLAFYDKDYDKAKSLAEQSIAWGLDSPLNRLIAGMSAFYLHNWELTNYYLQSISQVLPENHAALRMLVTAKLHLNEIDTAAELYKEFDTQGILDVALAIQLNNKLEQLNQPELAKQIKLHANQTQLNEAHKQQLKVANIKKIQFDYLEQALLKAITQKNRLYQSQQLVLIPLLNPADKYQVTSLLEQWQSSGVENLYTYYTKAWLAMQNKNLIEFEHALTEAYKIEPDNVPSLKYFLQKALVEQNNQQVLDLTNQIIKLSYPDSLMYTARLDALNKLNQLNLKHLNELLTLPVGLDFNRLNCLYLLNQEQYLLLLKYLAQTDMTKWPEINWIAFIKTKLATDNFSEVAAGIKQFILKDTSNGPDAMQAMINAAFHIEQTDLVLNLTELAAQKKLAIPQLNLLTAKAYLLSNHLTKAENILKHTQANSLFYYDLAAELALKKQSNKEAYFYFLQAYQLAEDFHRLSYLFRLADKVDKTEEVKALALTYLNENKQNIEAYKYIADWFIQKEPQLALQILESGTLESIRYTDWVLANNLAWLYFKQGQQSKAEVWAKQALKLQPDNLNVKDTYNQVFRL